MAHYALIDENNIVVQVITGINENIIQTDLDGTQIGGSTKAWEDFYASRPWFAGLKCKRTSYNSIDGKWRNPENNIITDQPGFRKNFAGIGYIYNDAGHCGWRFGVAPNWSLRGPAECRIRT